MTIKKTKQINPKNLLDLGNWCIAQVMRSFWRLYDACCCLNQSPEVFCDANRTWFISRRGKIGYINYDSGDLCIAYKGYVVSHVTGGWNDRYTYFQIANRTSKGLQTTESTHGVLFHWGKIVYDGRAVGVQFCNDKALLRIDNSNALIVTDGKILGYNSSDNPTCHPIPVSSSANIVCCADTFYVSYRSNVIVDGNYVSNTYLMVFGQSNEIIWEGQVKSGEIPGTRNYWTSDSSRYIRCDGGVCCFVNSYWDEYFRYLGWVDLDDKFYIVCNGKFLEDSNGVKNVWIKEAYLLNNSVPYVTLFNLETEMLSAYLWEHKIGELYYPPLTKALEMYPNNWYERIIYADGTTTYRVVNIPLADNSGAGLTNNFLQSLVGAFVKFNGELYYARWRDHIIHLASDDENNVYGITSFLDVYEANHTPAAEAPIGTLPRYRFFVRNGFGTFRRKYSGAEGQEWGVPENPVLMPDFFSQAESLNSSILHGGGNEFTKKFCTPETFTYQLVRGTHGDDPEEENYINDASFPGDYVELASDPGGFAVYQEKTFKCITRKMAFEIDPDEPPYKTSRITSCSGGGVAPLNMGMDRCACYADVEWAIVAFKHVCSTYPAFFIIKNGEYVDNWTGVGALPLIYRKEASYIDICNGGTGGTTATLFATGEYTRNYFSPITAWSYSEHCFRFFLVTGQGIISELYGEPVPPDLPVRLRTRYLYTNCPVNPGAMLCCGNNSEVTYFYKGANNEYIWGEGTGNVKSCDVYIRGKFVANVAPIHNAICCDRFIVVQDVSDSTLWSVWTYSDEPKHWDFNFTQTPSITHCCNGIMKLQAQTTEGLRCIFFGYEGVFAESDANDCNDYTILCCGTKRAIAVNANISFVVDDTFGLIPIDMYNLKVLDNVHETDFLNYNETRIKKLTMEDIETNE